MKICGVIAEYNPFHSGHALHLREARRMTGCDYIVVCMVGSCTQRGEAACMDKWSRARAALMCGADAVFELPALWAVRTADAFARGGVAILSGLGCDALSFGCEIDDLALLDRLSMLRENESEALKSAIRQNLADGKSHARARGEALADLLGLPADVLNAPNLTLGAEYLRACRELQAEMQLALVPRLNGYHDTALGEIASATAIRAALTRGEADKALECVPEAVRGLLAGAPRMHAPDDLLLYRLRRSSAEQLAALPDVTEGLEHRLLKHAQTASGCLDLIDRVKCKRYTRARIARLCAHALLEMDRALVDAHPLPEYARLLGLRRDARPLMNALSQRSKLPIVSNASELRGSEIFHLECRATDLRALLCDEPSLRVSGLDCTQKFVSV